MEELKKCSKCGIDRPTRSFNKDDRYRDNLNPWCSVCNSERKRRWREKLKAEAIYESPEEQACLRCRKVFSSSSFGVDRSRKTGLRPYCKPCDLAYHQEYVADHPQKTPKHKAREYMVKYRANHHEEIVQRQRDLKLAVFTAYGGPVCVCCGEAIFEFLTVDHINSNGGAHRRALAKVVKYLGLGGIHFYAWLRRQGFPPGYQVLCWNCNSGRHVNGGICPHKQKELHEKDSH